MGIIIPIIIIIVLSAIMQGEKAKRQKSNSPAEKTEKTQRQNPGRYAETKSEPKREDRIFAPHERYRESKSYKPEAEKIQPTGIIEKSGAENFLASTEKLPLTVQSVVWAEVLSEPKAMQ